jgi:hypothetical protein
MNRRLPWALVLVLAILVLCLTSNRLPAQSGACGGVTVMLPFNDVAGNLFFCQIAEAFFSGLTNGTTPTTYSPSDNVPREQMAAFITRTQDSALRRGSRRAALGQWAFPTSVTVYSSIGGNAISVSNDPRQVKSDGEDVWVACHGSSRVDRIHASNGELLASRSLVSIGTGYQPHPSAILIARGLVWVTDDSDPGGLYVLYDTSSFNSFGRLATNLGASPLDLTTDGTYIFTANFGAATNGSVSRIPLTNPGSATVINYNGGFTRPAGILFDGQSIWVCDYGDNTLKKLDVNGNFLQVVPVGNGPTRAVFDGSNIWVPNYLSNTMTVVRARDGMVLATLTGNGLSSPVQAAFDGERILVTNQSGNSVSLWKAADFSLIGTYSVSPIGPLSASEPFGACSDGINFWITLRNGSVLARL